MCKDLETFKLWPETMERWERMFTEYPKMAGEVFNAMFVVDGVSQKHLKDRIMPVLKERGLFKLLGEVRRACRAL